jgi:RHS repeat-associated protein
MSAMLKMFQRSLSAALCVVLAVITLAPAAQAARVTTYYHTDGLGSVVAASNQAGELLWRKEYAPFGHQIDQTPDTEKLGYTGKPHDSVLGLTNLGARYYDPHLGRFMSPDPVGFVESNPMSFNRYAYVNNNPYKYVDPDGEFLNFAAKFVFDVGVNIAFNYITTGEVDVGGALKESAIGILNPAKTVAKAGKLANVILLTHKKLPGPVNKTKLIDDAVGPPKGPDFIVSSGGTAFPVPKGATGPRPVINPGGKQTGDAFTGGKGGENGQVATMRIMDPTSPRGSSPGYPKGYVKYENKGGQGVDPYSGRTLANKDSHFPLD